MKKNDQNNESKLGKVKPYQELNETITENSDLKEMQPTPQPKDFDEIEY